VLKGITEAEIAESLACREGLALASDLLIRRFRLASDCANVVKKLTGDGMASYGQIIREVMAGGRSFEAVEFVHENRQANNDAHLLARSSIYSQMGRYVWFLAPPDGVCNSYNA